MESLVELMKANMPQLPPVHVEWENLSYTVTRDGACYGTSAAAQGPNSATAHQLIFARCCLCGRCTCAGAMPAV